MAKVNPKILTWARETAGLSLAEAAHAINLNPAHGQTGEERLAALERGQGEPTRPLLRRMVKKYRRPLLVFYLAEAPAQGDRGEDFRTLAGRAPPEFDPLLDELIREVRARHAVVKSLLEDDDPVQRTFVGSKDMSDGAAAVAKDICTTTGFDLKRFRSRSDVDDAFAYLRACLERSGIFVLLMGNLGSRHSNIGPRAFSTAPSATTASTSRRGR